MPVQRSNRAAQLRLDVPVTPDRHACTQRAPHAHTHTQLHAASPARFTCVMCAQELIYRGADLVDVLRLVVLLSAVGGGLPRRQLDALRQELLHTYGHQHILTLNSLEKSGEARGVSCACMLEVWRGGCSCGAGLQKCCMCACVRLTGYVLGVEAECNDATLKRSGHHFPCSIRHDAWPGPLCSCVRAGLLKVSPGGKSQFSAVRKALQLIVPEDEAPPAGPGSGPGPSAAAPTDVSYLYKGYAPLSIRLVEAALR